MWLGVGLTMFLKGTENRECVGGMDLVRATRNLGIVWCGTSLCKFHVDHFHKKAACTPECALSGLKPRPISRGPRVAPILLVLFLLLEKVPAPNKFTLCHLAACSSNFGGRLTQDLDWNRLRGLFVLLATRSCESQIWLPVCEKNAATGPKNGS